MKQGHQAIIIQPFISVVSEKVNYMRKLVRNSIVCGYYSNNRSIPYEKTDISLCTIERAHSLIARISEDPKLLKRLSIVVCDELHLVGDQNRGYLLELMLTKLKFKAPHVRIIGMSATLPNISLLAAWLDAKLFQTDYRPVPLTEFIIQKDTIYDLQLNPVRKFEYPPHPRDPDMLIPLCFEVLKANKSVLVFCPSKDGCEKTGMLIASLLNIKTDDSVNIRRNVLLSWLSSTPSGLDSILERTIPRGIAYHHAGMNYILPFTGTYVFIYLIHITILYRPDIG
jgi:replicative superfamily II helicase